MKNDDTLINRLEEIVDAIHIAEVKKIISILSKINSFKHIIEDDLSSESIYKKIKYELKSEFEIDNFKVIQHTNKIDTTLFELENQENYSYEYKSKVSESTTISILINKEKMTEFEILTLNSYFSEIVHLIYIQYILSSLQASALQDPLTKLQNRISFNQEMRILIPLALREKMKIGALLINIDRFRAVNDEHGNDFGDKFLKLYADTIQKIIRSSDVAVRFAGGEFLILLVNVESEEKTIEIADKIREISRSLFRVT